MEQLRDQQVKWCQVSPWLHLESHPLAFCSECPFKALFHPVTNLFCICHSQPSCLLYHNSSNRDSGSREKSGWAPPCISAVWHHLSPSCPPFPGFHIPSLCPDQPPFTGSLLSPPRPLPLVAIGADSRHGRLLHHHRLHQVCHRPPAPPRGLEPIISSNLTRTIPPTHPFRTVDQPEASP